VMPPAMTEKVLVISDLTGETKFRVTRHVVRRRFFIHAKSHHGKVPVKTNSAAGTLDEEGWLWCKVVKQGAPPMSDKLARRLHERLAHEVGPLLLVVAPSGAGKSFGAWQLGTLRHVDLLDANRNNQHSLFSEWRRAVKANMLPDALVLKPGETAATVGRPKLNSRKAVYHAWILFCALAAMRAQCAGPSDWLFLQRHCPARVSLGYSEAVAVARKYRLHYEALENLVTLHMGRGPQTVVVVDEATHALPYKHDPTFAPLRATTPPSSTRSPISTFHADRVSAVSRAPGSGTGRGAGAGSTTGDDGRASNSGLLGCLLQAVMGMRGCMIAMGTSLSLARATHVVQSASDQFQWPAPLLPYMEVHAFPQLSADDCAKYITFYADRLDVDLDPGVLSGVCQQLQGAC